MSVLESVTTQAHAAQTQGHHEKENEKEDENERILDLQPWTRARFLKYYNWIELICQADHGRAKELARVYRERFYRRNVTHRDFGSLTARRYCCEVATCDLFDIYARYGRSYVQAERSFYSRLYWAGRRWLAIPSIRAKARAVGLAIK